MKEGETNPKPRQEAKSSDDSETSAKIRDEAKKRDEAKSRDKVKTCEGKRRHKAKSSAEGKTRDKEEEKKKQYSCKDCPVCGDTVVHLGRHIVDVHIKKNECLPVVRLTLLLEMGKYLNSRRGKPRKERAADGSTKTYKGRRRVICPVCDKVQLYISTHLRRKHHFLKGSSQYNTAMKHARYFEGASKEIEVDVRIHHGNRKRSVKEDSVTKAYQGKRRKKETTSDSNSDESDASDVKSSKNKKGNHGLDVLMAEFIRRRQ